MPEPAFRKLKRAMKKTNEKWDILKIFSQKKFVRTDYDDDKQRIIDKYNEKGYRDAVITAERSRQWHTTKSPTRSI